MIKLFKKIYFTERNRKVGGGARSVFWWVRLVWFSWQQTTTYNGLKLILIIAMRNIVILLTFRFCEIFLRFCYKHTTIVLWKYYRLKSIVLAKVRSRYGLLAYFSYILISGKNAVTSQQKWQHFCQKWKYLKNMQAYHNLNRL